MNETAVLLFHDASRHMKQRLLFVEFRSCIVNLFEKADYLSNPVGNFSLVHRLASNLKFRRHCHIILIYLTFVFRMSRSVW